ncbi:MAG: hypothetical protein DMD36_10945 [Gemmatimonadetes bacterium]|nr:MAG: hypothetical protein DMD36_10945 [Gemmatimonadota bacterium]
MPTDTEFSHRTRAAALRSMSEQPVDVLIIGGGITGAGIAREAALRGYRTALVDKGDFGGGTSSRSSRLVHGGIRYLEQFHLRLVYEASRERRVLLDIAAARHRASPRAPACLPLSRVPRGPRAALGASRRDVALRSARRLPQRADAPLAPSQGRAAAGAGPAGEGAPGRRVVLRRANRRRPIGDRHDAKRRPGGRAGGELCRSDEPHQARWPHLRGDGPRPADPPAPHGARPGRRERGGTLGGRGAAAR